MGLFFHPWSEVLAKIRVKTNSAPDKGKVCGVDHPDVYPQHLLARNCVPPEMI